MESVIHMQGIYGNFRCTPGASTLPGIGDSYNLIQTFRCAKKKKYYVIHCNVERMMFES